MRVGGMDTPGLPSSRLARRPRPAELDTRGVAGGTLFASEFVETSSSQAGSPHTMGHFSRARMTVPPARIIGAPRPADFLQSGSGPRQDTGCNFVLSARISIGRWWDRARLRAFAVTPPPTEAS